MNRKRVLSKVFTAAFLLTAMVLCSANQALARTETENRNRPNPTGDGTAPAAGGSGGYVSGVFSVLPGQMVRVAAVNMGNKVIPIEIVFVPVSEQGKASVPIRCNWTPAPGDAAIEKYTIPDGTSNRVLMYVQIRFQDAGDLKNIAPSLEVFNEQPDGAGEPHFFLGSDGFAGIRPIWVPS